MLCVPCYLAPSPINGFGIFASEFIKKDTLVWRFVEGFDLSFDKSFLLSLPEQAQEFLKTYGHVSSMAPGKVFLCSDMYRFMNHSRTPNTYDAPPHIMEEFAYAACDIAAGEEITTDYRTQSEDYYGGKNSWL